MRFSPECRLLRSAQPTCQKYWHPRCLLRYLWNWNLYSNKIFCLLFAAYNRRDLCLDLGPDQIYRRSLGFHFSRHIYSHAGSLPAHLKEFHLLNCKLSQFSIRRNHGFYFSINNRSSFFFNLNSSEQYPLPAFLMPSFPLAFLQFSCPDTEAVRSPWLNPKFLCIIMKFQAIIFSSKHVHYLSS
mgnify:CR=1 FL=1